MAILLAAVRSNGTQLSGPAGAFGPRPDDHERVWAEQRSIFTRGVCVSGQLYGHVCGGRKIGRSVGHAAGHGGLSGCLVTGECGPFPYTRSLGTRAVTIRVGTR